MPLSCRLQLRRAARTTPARRAAAPSKSAVPARARHAYNCAGQCHRQKRPVGAAGYSRSDQPTGLLAYAPGKSTPICPHDRAPRWHRAPRTRPRHLDPVRMHQQLPSPQTVCATIATECTFRFDNPWHTNTFTTFIGEQEQLTRCAT